jgi:hypothetical protein
LPKIDAKNKFLNVHEAGLEEEGIGESNAISDNIESHPPVNLEGSQVSNRHFDEKMISTVMSEQVESGVGTKGEEKTLKEDMEKINEVNRGDNDESKLKSGSNRTKNKEMSSFNDPLSFNKMDSRQNKNDEFGNFDDGFDFEDTPEQVEKKETVPPKRTQNNRAPEPVRPKVVPVRPEKQALKSSTTNPSVAAKQPPVQHKVKPEPSKPIKEVMPSKSKDAVKKDIKPETVSPNKSNQIATSKQNTQQKAATKRPQSSQPIKPVKQEAPSEPKPKERVPVFGLKEKKPKPVDLNALLKKENISTKKQCKEIGKDGLDDDSHGEDRQGGDEEVGFKDFLKLMKKKVKADILTGEEDQKWKPKKKVEISETELRKEMLKKDQKSFQKQNLSQQILEAVQRAAELEEARKKLEEFKSKNEIKYPKYKRKTEPTIEPPKEKIHIKDPIQEANEQMRIFAKQLKAKKEEKEKKREHEQPTMFEEETVENGDQCMPISPPSRTVTNGKNLKNLSMHESEMMEVVPELEEHTKQIHHARVDKDREAYNKVMKERKEREKRLKEKENDIFTQEEIEKRVKRDRIKQIDHKLEALEKKFNLDENQETEFEINHKDKLATKNKFLRYGKPKNDNRDQSNTGRTGWDYRIGEGVPSKFERDVKEWEKKDIKVRTFERTEKLKEERSKNEQEKMQFKEKLKEQKVVLEQIHVFEQEKVAETRAMIYKKGTTKPAVSVSPKKEDAKINDVAEESEKEEEETQASTTKPSIKMKHVLKLRDYLGKMRQVNEGLQTQLKNRENAYHLAEQELQKNLQAAHSNAIKEKQKTLSNIQTKLKNHELFDLLRKDSKLLKVTEINKNLKDITVLTEEEKKLVKERVYFANEDLLTRNKLEEVLNPESLVTSIKVAKTAKEILLDNEVNKYSESLISFEESIQEYGQALDAKEMDSVEAYTRIKRLKNVQAKILVQMNSLIEALVTKTEDMMSEFSKMEQANKDILVHYEVANENNAKMGKLDRVYAKALKDFDEIDEELNRVKLFELDDFDELQKREADWVQTIYQSRQGIHSIGFRQLNNTLNFISGLSKQKKSALLIQSHFRRYKARKLYNKKLCLRDRTRYLVLKYILRFKKRMLLATLSDLLQDYFRNRAFKVFQRLKKTAVPYNRNLTRRTMTFIKGSLRPHLGHSATFSADGGEPTEKLDLKVSEKKEIKSFSLPKARASLQDVDGIILYASIIMQRLYRQARRKVNPGVFFVAAGVIAEKCRLCEISPISVVARENLICLYCESCFAETNSKRNRIRRFKRLEKGKPQPLANEAENIKRIIAKINSVQDLSLQFRAWDTKHRGAIEAEDAPLMLSRLKCITNAEKNLLANFLAFKRDKQGLVHYPPIIKEYCN